MMLRDLLMMLNQYATTSRTSDALMRQNQTKIFFFVIRNNPKDLQFFAPTAYDISACSDILQKFTCKIHFTYIFLQ